MKGLLLWRLLALAWTAKVFWLSTGAFGAEHTRSFLAGIFSVYDISISSHALDLMSTMLRKTAHLIEYAVLSYCLFRSLGGIQRLPSCPRLPLWCVAAAAVWSLADELHQAFVPGRFPSLLDCGIDTIGAAIPMLLVARSWHRQVRPEPATRPL